MTILHSNSFFRSERCSIAIEPRMPQSAFPEHQHDFYEVILVEQGVGVHVFNGQPFILSAGCICFVRDHDRHLFEKTEQLHLTNVLFKAPNDFRYLSDIKMLLPEEFDGIYSSHWWIDQQVMMTVKKLISSLDALLLSEKQEDIALYEGLFLQLMVYLRQGCLNVTEQNSEARVHQVLNWLEQHYTEDINWELLSDKFNLSLRTFYRQVKKYTGMTPQGYLNRIRLLRARYLLRHSEMNITTIAYQCGFGDSNHFSTLFKREFGQSPSELRHKLMHD